jgi:CHAD domain-containing protein
MAKAKEIDGLDCRMRAGDGISLILRVRLEEMCSNRAAALDWSNIEGVHDMRVASRRLRSALKDFLPYLRKRKLKEARQDLRSVARTLGAVRDQDVALVALEKLAAEAPPELSAGIEHFASMRRHILDDARSRLEAALSEDALEKLQRDCHDALEESSKVSRDKDEDEEAFAGDAELHQVAREILDERLRDLQELSASLFQPFEIVLLHEMRIAAKRLRYAIELFTPCLGGDALKPFCKEIARMQDSLGELHDCDVWIIEIGGRLNTASTEKFDVESHGDRTKGHVNNSAAPEEGADIERQAMFWLLDYFVKERTEHFRAALEHWREWQATGFQEQLIATIHNQPPAAESSPPASSTTETVADGKSAES